MQYRFFVLASQHQKSCPGELRSEQLQIQNKMDIWWSSKKQGKFRKTLMKGNQKNGIAIKTDQRTGSLVW